MTVEQQPQADLGQQALRAFERDLPRLWEERPGQWVAYQGERLLEFGTHKHELYHRCFDQGLARGDFVIFCIEPRETEMHIGPLIDEDVGDSSSEVEPVMTVEQQRRADLGQQALRAFERDLPRLWEERPGQWVAYQGERLLGFATQQHELYHQCFDQGLARGEFDIFCIEPLENEMYIGPWLDEEVRDSVSEVKPVMTEEQQRRADLGQQALRAFERDLPRLWEERPGQWVAYQGERLLGFAKQQHELYHQCFDRGLTDDEFDVFCIEPLETEMYIGPIIL